MVWLHLKVSTARGGMTSHAAVVARGRKNVASGAGELVINEHEKTVAIHGKTFHEGDEITLDGSTGEVFAGALKVVDPELSGDFEKLMNLTDKYKTLGVRTNADTPADATMAKRFAVEGICLL